MIRSWDVPRPPSSTLASSSSPRRVQLTTPTHVTQSPFASASKNKHVLQAENHKLFSEFMEHVVAVTQDCPQVLEYLKMNHAKARTDYLSSVEFRNSLGRCLTRLEAKRSRVFVYIYELCMVLKQHKDRSRKKKNLETPSTSASDCLHSTSLKSESQTAETGAQVQGGNPAAQDEKPSTSGLQKDQQKVEEKASRASRKQVSVSMMKIYNKLCELKDCSSLTGRILERKILYSDTSYPEISRKIQRYINSPDVCLNPPDYQDILQQVQLASKRHNLRLSSKELERIARKAFADTGSKIQQRRHHDLLYDFGCQLTSEYNPDNDPALKDPTLLRKLENNRELGLNRLEDVINKYAIQQDNADKKDKARRHVEEVRGLRGHRLHHHGKFSHLFCLIGFSRMKKRRRTTTCPQKEVEVLLDMGVICASPLRAVDRSDCQLVSSSQSPPPKKYKVRHGPPRPVWAPLHPTAHAVFSRQVNVATQCDPLEIIELSDSE
uniref:Death domain-associated protein 6 n=1 Tax=Hippocampus comes TaxID=109280 RepID=A0A3Q2YJF1_HIPCM